MPVIKKGSDYMQAVTYTGNGSTQTINVGFQPDLVWIKSRSAATDNKLVDSVRGATLALSSNTTGAEATDSTGITAFTSTGFTLGANSTYNTNGATYVAWCWKKGATPGFDIVTYTGNGTAGRTVAHSLGVAPSFAIFKKRASGTNNWLVWSAARPLAMGYLNLTNAFDASGATWAFNGVQPTSSVVTLGSDDTNNGNGSTYVAYLFAEIPGFSKFGSYTGNGSTDGPFVYCGFRPRYIMIKKTDAASPNGWEIWDTARDTYNQAYKRLWANLSDAENTTTPEADILSNGFKVRTVSNDVNTSGGTYIYAAFAENPFKYSLAR